MRERRDSHKLRRLAGGSRNRGSSSFEGCHSFLEDIDSGLTKNVESISYVTAKENVQGKHTFMIRL